MSWFQAMVLGVVQGLTEFLPISSSGHLIIIPIIFKWSSHDLVFDTTLHLGTALALIVYFWKDLFLLAKSFVRDVFKCQFAFGQFSNEGKLAVYVLIGCIPAGVLGVLLDNMFETVFRGLLTAVVFLILGGLLMWFAEAISKNNFDDTVSLSSKKSLVIGFFQALALFPGISRSGSTISGGMLLGLKREAAARFSFLLSIPIVLSAALFKLVDSYSLVLQAQLVSLVIGLLSSTLVGALAIKFLMHYLTKNSLTIFIIYRIVLAALIVFLLILRV